MSFASDLADDLGTFLDLDEFGEEQEFAGKNIPVVAEYLELDAQADSEQRQGVRYEGAVLHVSLLEVPDDFLPGKRVTWKGEVWWVLEADKELLRTIKLYRERS